MVFAWTILAIMFAAMTIASIVAGRDHEYFALACLLLWVMARVEDVAAAIEKDKDESEAADAE